MIIEEHGVILMDSDEDRDYVEAFTGKSLSDFWSYHASLEISKWTFFQLVSLDAVRDLLPGASSYDRLGGAPKRGRPTKKAAAVAKGKSASSGSVPLFRAAANSDEAIEVPSLSFNLTQELDSFLELPRGTMA